ncbi:MAG TPA: serine/threonine-protein kinase [Candidatus Acidoferrum sp.]|jgi:serine/threonine protein kinase/tetratricopeptide (TPR) repeat protein|nr:serine/threonine-protein kinase [Candidatus Acidoferrum sp.]
MAEESIGKMNGAPDPDIAVFTEALRLPPEERDRYLDNACKADVEFRRRVEALLDAYEQAGDFLGKSAAEMPRKAAQLLKPGDKPGDRIGHYKLLQQIGEGGCGVVYMAEQEEPVHRRVALKIIKPGMDTKSVIARFEAERQALALMDHPNIAKVFDAGATASGRPYFVMELVRGAKITEYCDQHSLTTEERLKLFIQVCQAVQHAHQRGVIHRDIKPSNILVTQSLEGVATPLVIDFGVAKATTDQPLTDKTVFTAFEMLIGTPAYMSPEQAELSSVDVDTRTDIYSLGVLLYELLTDSTPFETRELLKAGLDEIRRVIREQEPLRPSTRLSKMPGAHLTTVAQHRRSEPPKLIRAISGDLDWIVMKAMEKNRTRRYETANGLALDVQRFLAHEPISARPPSKLYKFQKTVQRNRLLFIGLGIIATLLIVSLIVVSAFLAQERQARREARQVKQFLEEMLQSVGPNVAEGGDTAILRDILDQTASRVGKELTNQPAVEAEMRSVIGGLYCETRQFRQAEEMQRASLAIRRKRFGSESAQAAASLNELGLTLLTSGRLSEAEQVNREALEIRLRRFGNENADVAASQNNLAHVYAQMGRLTEAEALARESLETRQRLFGNPSVEVADSLRTIAVILGDKLQWAEAEAMAREVLDMQRKLFGPEDTRVASALNDVARAAAANGKQKEAEDLEREALAMRQKLLSQDHPDVANSLYLVGDRMRQRGNLKEAYPVLSTALSMQRKVLGEDHPATLDTLKSLGLMYEAEKEWSQAETVFRQLVAAWRKRVGDDDLETLYALRNLAEALGGQGKWSEEETVHREALVSWRKREGNGGSETSYTLHLLGNALAAQRKWSQAEIVFREELAFRSKQARDDDPNTLYALRDLGIALEFEGRWAEAEIVHQDSLASWRKRAGNDDPQTLYTLDRLGWTLEGQGKWPEAESAYREALASRRKVAGNDDSQTLTEFERLTRVLMRQKRLGEAEQLLEEALTPAMVRQPSSCNLLIRRVDLLGRQGRWQEAAATATLVVEYQPTDQFRYHVLAALLAITRNRPAYETFCRKILATFTNTSDPYIDERMTKDCLFLPDSGVDLKFVDELADKAVSLGSGNADAAYFQVAKAMSAYRLGRFAESVEWSEKTLKSSITYPTAHAYAILAMAHWELAHKDVARAMLDKGDSLTPNILPSHQAVDLGDSWVAWLQARISLDEATALIQPASRTESNSQEP